MKLIIDVDEQTLEEMNASLFFSARVQDRLAEAIANGTPYNPTGDLISREALEKAIKDNGYSHYFEIFEIIDNAPSVNNPKGDLISREALKKDIEAERHNLLTRGQVGAEHILVHHCLPIIDNAPTVPQVTVFTEDADEKAIEDMKAELQSVIEARPSEQIAWEQGYEAGLAQGKQDKKGEWKLVEKDNQDIDVVCPFCNSTRFPAYSHGYTLEELEEYLIRQHLPKFCEDCGADMREAVRNE